MQPLILCAYEIDVGPIFDSIDQEKCRASNVLKQELSCRGWEREMLTGSIPASQTLSDRLISEGFAGMQVQSFAAGVNENDANLVLWKWGSRLPAKVLLIDEDGRLANSQLHN